MKGLIFPQCLRWYGQPLFRSVAILRHQNKPIRSAGTRQIGGRHHDGGVGTRGKKTGKSPCIGVKEQPSRQIGTVCQMGTIGDHVVLIDIDKRIKRERKTLVW